MGHSLIFGPGDIAGWTPVGVSSFQSMKPTAAIRELIQNGTDAVADAGEEVTHMRFYVSRCSVKNLPAIDSYRDAFNRIQETLPKIFGGKLPDNAEAISDEIEHCLGKEDCEVLHVLDNGIGLDRKRMGGLFGDGVSVKDVAATGSYGNGHVVVFPASDLRYVAYGGLSSEGRIAAGHAILASRENEKPRAPTLSKDGYLVKSLHENDLLDRYTFYEGKDIPKLISEQLHWIEQHWGRGSAVAILGFNHFRERTGKSSLKDVVFRAAACSFFEAIYNGKLTIEVVDSGETSHLDKNSLFTVLENYRDEKRSRDSFLSGSRAYEACLTLRDGKSLLIDTPSGPVEILVRHPVEMGRTRVDLCRNGMWVTDKIPRFQNKFGDLQTFHSVFPLRRNPVFNRLVRKSEGPLHNSLCVQEKLNVGEQKQLHEVLRAIREKLCQVIPKLDGETFRPSNIFVLPKGGLAQGGKNISLTGTPTQVKRTKPPIADTGGSGGAGARSGSGRGTGTGDGRAGEFKRGGAQMRFQALIVPTGRRSCQIEVVSGEQAAESEIRFALDESIDVTSDGMSTESYVSVVANTLRLNSAPVSAEQLRTDSDGKVCGVSLGKLKEGQKCEIELDYEIPPEIPVVDDQQVVLKVEMVRRAASA